jgi:hypothetical protein
LAASNNRFASNHVWPVHSASIRIHSHDPFVDNVRGNVIEGNLLYGAYVLEAVRVVVPPRSTAALYYVQRWIHSSNANAMFTGRNPNIVRNNTTGSVTSKSSLLWELQSGQDSAFLDRNQWAASQPR